jgi:3-methyladenine DNA glycosylase/8-oxoguanine DNA glycosylase
VAAPHPADLARATAHLRRADPVLGRLIDAVGPCRLAVDRGGSHFGALVESIVYQQITGKAAAAIHARLCAALGRRPRPEDLLAASTATLRRVGLSRQKVGYLRDLARQARNGLPLQGVSRLSDEAIVAALTRVKGIGRWTVEMFLIFRLGRPDVFPVDDYGIRKGMQRAYRRRELPDVRWMRQKAAPWRPYRTVASWYLWRCAEGAGA